MPPRGVTNNNLLLAALPASDYALLAAHLADVTLPPGSLLQDRGEKIRYVYFPRSGMISLIVVMQNGEEIETGTVGREGAIGTMSGCGVPRASMRAVVQLPGVIARIGAAQFQKALRESRTLSEIFARYADVLLAQTQQAAACNALHTVEPRLCRWLLQVRDRVDSGSLPLTQEALAQMLGVRRTTVTLAARGLQNAGLIRYRRGQIEILSLKALQETACECYHIIQAQYAQALSKQRT
jgi:CRP-like cAMP-binding protein